MIEIDWTAVLLVLLGPGGIAVLWAATARDKRIKRQDEEAGGDPTVAEAHEAEALNVTAASGVMSPGVASEWQSYADALEAKFNERMSDMERRLSAAELRNEGLQQQNRHLVRRDLVWMAHVGHLERHIDAEQGPPTPGLPEELQQPITEILAKKSGLRTDHAGD